MDKAILLPAVDVLPTCDRCRIPAAVLIERPEMRLLAGSTEHVNARVCGTCNEQLKNG